MASEVDLNRSDLTPFLEVMRVYPTGVTVVSTETPAGPYGLTVNSFTSLSLEPPLILVCLDNRLSGFEQFVEAGQFAVNILASDQQEASIYFSTPGTDRSHYLTGTGEMGLPLLEGALAVLECELSETFPGGDHTILVGRVRVARRFENRAPLVFLDGGYTSLK